MLARRGGFHERVGGCGCHEYSRRQGRRRRWPGEEGPLGTASSEAFRDGCLEADGEVHGPEVLALLTSSFAWDHLWTEQDVTLVGVAGRCTSPIRVLPM